MDQTGKPKCSSCIGLVRQRRKRIILACIARTILSALVYVHVIIITAWFS